MKKKYNQPTVKLHNVGVHQMLCGSDPVINNEGTDAKQLGKEDIDDDFGW